MYVRTNWNNFSNLIVTYVWRSWRLMSIIIFRLSRRSFLLLLRIDSLKDRYWNIFSLLGISLVFWIHGNCLVFSLGVRRKLHCIILDRVIRLHVGEGGFCIRLRRCFLRRLADWWGGVAGSSSFLCPWEFFWRFSWSFQTFWHRHRRP